MNNLVIDIGNSLAKAGLFYNSQLQKAYTLPSHEVLSLIRKEKFDTLIVSSVATQLVGLEQEIASNQNYFLLTSATPLPFQNLYQTPHTLGTDRIAAIAGAISLFPGQAVLAIDTGTCITYDIADGQGHYYGGSISPGLHMRGRAMHTFTARLPLVDIKQKEIENFPLIGYDTLSSLQSGVLHGTLAEITQMIRMYADKFGDLQVVICGGDATMLSQGVSASHTLVPELILIGLNRILEYNVS